MFKTSLYTTLFGLLTLAFTINISALDGEQAEELYRQGQDALNSGRYEAALDSFEELVTKRPEQADRALYWQAYALNKVGRKNQALAALRQLVSEYPQSPWRDDAEALQIEVEGIKGSHTLDNVDDDLKLYALDALHQVEPEKAVQLLERFLDGNHSSKLKEHALFILAQTDSERAAKILVDIARGGQSRELQRHAIQALGIVGDGSANKTLIELYKESNDRDIKETVLHSLIAADAKTEVAALMREEKDPSLLESGLHTLGAMGAGRELQELARTLPRKHYRSVLQAMGIAGETDAIVDIMNKAKDEPTLVAAIEALAITHDGGQQVTDELHKLYRSTPSRGVKSRILQAFMIQNDAETLMSIFRQEKDRELKREALQALTMIEGPETDKLIEELLEG